MISDWWNNTTSRERGLIAVAGGLSLLIFLWMVVLNPAFEARNTAEQRLAIGENRLSQVENALQIKRVKSLTLTGEEFKSDQVIGPLKATITNTASELGLSVSRIQGLNEEGVGVFIDQADPRLLYFWIDDLERNYGAEVTRLTVEQVGGSAVNARIEVEPKS